MSEEEIIKIIKEYLSKIYIEYTKVGAVGIPNEEWYAIQELLDLYNKEKEKNLIFKGATIVSDLENNGIEMKMNADKLIALYLEEKEKNKELEEYKKISELTKISCCTAQNCEALNNAIREGLENQKLREQLEQEKKANDVDLTVVYMNGSYDEEKKWKDKIKEELTELDNMKVDGEVFTTAVNFAKKILKKLLEEE